MYFAMQDWLFDPWDRTRKSTYPYRKLLLLLILESIIIIYFASMKYIWCCYYSNFFFFFSFFLLRQDIFIHPYQSIYYIKYTHTHTETNKLCSLNDIGQQKYELRVKNHHIRGEYMRKWISKPTTMAHAYHIQYACGTKLLYYQRIFPYFLAK